MSDPRAKGGKGGANAKAEAKKQVTQSARAGLQVSIDPLRLTFRRSTAGAMRRPIHPIQSARQSRRVVHQPPAISSIGASCCRVGFVYTTSIHPLCDAFPSRETWKRRVIRPGEHGRASWHGPHLRCDASMGME